MLRPDRLFIVFGVIFALGGMILGERMGATGDLTQRVTHVHALALGWIGAFLFGLAYRAWPSLLGWPAWTHLALHTAGVSVMIYMLWRMFSGAVPPETAGPILGLSGLAVMLGVASFGINFLFRAGRLPAPDRRAPSAAAPAE